MLLVLLVAFLCVSAARGQVSDAEITQISEDIWLMAKNGNNARRGLHYQVNTGGPVLYPQFDTGLFSRATYGAFRNLITRYNPQIGEPDDDPGLRSAQNNFLSRVVRTPEMRALRTFLSDRGLASSSESGFQAELDQWWMQGYSRSGGAETDSSGFEHVFAGEIRESGAEVTGYHNWIKHYLDEQNGSMEYGRRIRSCPSSPWEVLTYNFDWRGAVKSIGGSFVGTSPEVELALKTLCFRAKRGSNCYVRIGDEDVQMVTHNHNGAPLQPTIGTAYARC